MTDATEARSPQTPAVTPEAAAAYLERRVKPQQIWYDRRSNDAKAWHYRLTGAQMVSTAAIPVINVFTHSVMASSVLAFVAAIAAGFSQLWKHHEHWTRYRATATALETLQIRYDLRLPPFDGEDAPAKAIEEADRLLGDEGSKWSDAIRSSAKTIPAKAPVLASADDS